MSLMIKTFLIFLVGADATHMRVVLLSVPGVTITAGGASWWDSLNLTNLQSY